MKQSEQKSDDRTKAERGSSNKNYSRFKREYSIVSKKSILRWDEGLPLGNGKLGCLIYGDGPLLFSLDRVDLWDTRPHPNALKKEFCYAELVRLSTSGKQSDWRKRAELFEDVYAGKPYPSKITAGRLELNFFKKTENVSSRLDIQTAIADVDFDGVKVQAFMHADLCVGAAKIGGRYALSFHLPAYLGKSGMGYPPVEISKEDHFIYYRQNTNTDFSYGAVALSVKRGQTYELYFTVATSEDGEDFISQAKKRLLSAAETGYETLKKTHVAWWKAYWEKSNIFLSDELLEKTYYRSWYLFASCSKKGGYPMPLQGVWTADNEELPPWKGDYHHDTNTQLSYQAYLKANRLEEGEAFIDYLWSLKSQFERVAKEFYGVNGLLIPGVSTLEGKPMGGWAQYSLSPTMTIWSAMSFEEYYLYTGDRAFLETRAYPFFEEVGEAFLGLLQEREGKLYLPLSSSPEIFDDGKAAYLTPNSNFDLALIRYLFKTLIRYCGILNKDGGRYASALKKMDTIALIDGKFIALDKTQKLEESHRHFSHLMCLYPLHLINYDTAEHKELYHAALDEIERLGTENWVGFSFAMCAQIYAMAQSGNGAYEKLRQFADGFVGENGFHLNGDFKNKGYSAYHYRPFTLEASFGFCDALQEMLLQEHQGYLHLFPAIPDVWRKRRIAFENLRTYGGTLVSAAQENGAATEFSLKSRGAATLKIRNVFGRETLTFLSGDGREIKIHCPVEENFTLTFEGEIHLKNK